MKHPAYYVILLQLPQLKRLSYHPPITTPNSEPLRIAWWLIFFLLRSPTPTKNHRGIIHHPPSYINCQRNPADYYYNNNYGYSIIYKIHTPKITHHRRKDFATNYCNNRYITTHIRLGAFVLLLLHLRWLTAWFLIMA